jgi:serine/threonine protein kinase
MKTPSGGDRADFVHLESSDAAAGMDGMSGPRDGALNQRIGEYELLRELGRGGMGVVYLARQVSLDRLVALKVLPFASALDSRQIERFRNEARAAALIQHPNIASVYAVGCENGVHFYAMQYIDGRALDQFVPGVPCNWLEEPQPESASYSLAAIEAAIASLTGDTHDRHLSSPGGARHEYAVENDWLARPGTREHVRQVACVGIQVAEALRQAHEYGVIHRDIKPSNLLLDRQGRVWITDFGLARIQSDARVTQTGDIVGTLRYMSPEQAFGIGRILDERTDIYSLGVALYELATQRLAFAGDDRHEILRRIADEDPVPLRRINPEVPVDLETIVLKAMAKVPEQRYASARAFAEDLKNYLEGKPIAARRAGWAERWTKWTRRHRVAVRGALAASFAMLLVLTLTTVFVLAANRRLTTAHEEVREANVRLREALDESEQSQRQAKESLQRARTHFRQARQVVDLFGTRYAEALQGLPGAETLRYRVLQDTLDYYRRFVAHADDDPEFHRDMAVTYTKMAGMDKRLGNVAESLKDYRRAQALLEALVREKPDSASHLADLARCESNVGLLSAERGEAEEARRVYERAIGRQRSLVLAHPEVSKYRADLAVTHNNLALLESQAGNDEAAGRLFEEAARLEKGLVEREPGNVEYLAQRAVNLSNRSQLAASRQPAEAVAFCVEAIAIQRRLLELRPGDPAYRYDLALSHQNLGALRLAQHEFSDAKAACEKAIDLLDDLARATPAVVKYRFQAAVCRNNLGQVLMKLDRPRDARERFGRAAETLKALTAGHPESPAFQNGLGGTLNNLAGSLCQLGDLAAAEQAYLEAIAHQQRAVELSPEVPSYRRFLVAEYQNYAELLRQRGNPSGAERMELAARNAGLRVDAPLAAAGNARRAALTNIPNRIESGNTDRRESTEEVTP